MKIWMEQASKQEESQSTDKKGGDFLGFVLLSTPEFHVKEFRTALKEDWGIECPEDCENPRSEGVAIAFEVDGMLVTVGLMEIKVLDGEAEYWANSNLIL